MLRCLWLGPPKLLRYRLLSPAVSSTCPTAVVAPHSAADRYAPEKYSSVESIMGDLFARFSGRKPELDCDGCRENRPREHLLGALGSGQCLTHCKRSGLAGTGHCRAPCLRPYPVRP